MTFSAVFPCLRVSSRATLDFYVDAFGFTVTTIHPPRGDGVDHAELRLGTASIMCGTREGGPIDQPPAGSSTYWVLDGPDEEIDALHERAVTAGARSLVTPYDAPYGGRHCSLADPDGNAWSFGTYAGASADAS